MTGNIGSEEIAKVAEISIKSQLNRAEDISVDIETNPLDIAQGKIDSVTIDGKKMAIKKGLEAKRMILQTDRIQVNPIKAAMGNIELERTVDAECRKSYF